MPAQFMSGRPIHQRIERGIGGVFGQSRIKTANVVDQNADPSEIIDVTTDALQFVENGGVLRPLEGNPGGIMSIQPEIDVPRDVRQKRREHLFAGSVEDFYIAALVEESAGAGEQLRLRLDAVDLSAVN